MEYGVVKLIDPTGEIGKCRIWDSVNTRYVSAIDMTLPSPSSLTNAAWRNFWRYLASNCYFSEYSTGVYDVDGTEVFEYDIVDVLTEEGRAFARGIVSDMDASSGGADYVVRCGRGGRFLIVLRDNVRVVGHVHDMAVATSILGPDGQCKEK